MAHDLGPGHCCKALSSRGTLTKPTSGRSCQNFINMYPVQLEDRIHWIVATLSLKMPTMPTHYRLLVHFAAIFLTLEYKQRLVQEPPLERVVTRWSSHSEAMLQAALDDIDWDMFRASSSDVSEFTNVALSFVNTLTEQATETLTILEGYSQIRNYGWTEQSVLRLTNALSTRVFCWET